jgi:hypothetical protein
MGNTATKPQSSMSNAQMQTRGLSAADWTRLKRLRGARGNAENYSSGISVEGVLTTNKDINPTPFPQIPYSRPIQVYRSVGTSKIRRPASDWTAYKASQVADYPTPSGQIINGFESGTAQIMTRLCSCSNNILETKVAGCIKCQYDPIENGPKSTFNFNFQEINLDTEYSQTLSGQEICPIPTDFTNYVKLYQITIPSTGDYQFNLDSIGGSDHDICISYPNTLLGEDAIIAAMNYDYCSGYPEESLLPYFLGYSFNGSSPESVTRTLNAGDVIYILILTWDAGTSVLTVSQV